MRPALDQASMFPIGSVMDTIVLLNVAAIDATPCGTFFFSFFFVPARRAPAFGGFAVVAIPFSVARCPLSVTALARRTDNGERTTRCYFFVAFFLPAIAPLRGPFRVRALVCVLCPRTGRPRRCLMPR